MVERTSSKLALILETSDNSNEVIKNYREDKYLTHFLEENDIEFCVVQYESPKISNAGMGTLQPGIPNWYFYNDVGVIKRTLIGEFSIPDLIEELKNFYKIK